MHPETHPRSNKLKICYFSASPVVVCEVVAALRILLDVGRGPGLPSHRGGRPPTRVRRHLLAWTTTYETVADVPESRVRWRADFQSGSRVLKKVFLTLSYLYLWHTM